MISLKDEMIAKPGNVSLRTFLPVPGPGRKKVNTVRGNVMWYGSPRAYSYEIIKMKAELSQI